MIYTFGMSQLGETLGRCALRGNMKLDFLLAEYIALIYISHDDITLV